MIRKALLLGVLLLAFFHGSAPVTAAELTADEAYIRPSKENLATTYIAMSIMNDPQPNPDFLTRYTKFFYCKDYLSTHKNDFAIQDLLKKTVNRIKTFNEIIQKKYEHVYKVKLESYDSQKELYKFSADTAVASVRSLSFASSQDPKGMEEYLTIMRANPCIEDKSNFFNFTQSFRMSFDKPLTIDRLALSRNNAQALEDIFQATRRPRELYVRIGLTIYGAEPIGNPGYVEFNAKADFIEIYLDPELTQLLINFPTEG